MKRVILVLAVLINPCAALAQPAVFVVRHAERADGGTMSAPSADPDLSAAGRARADSLAAMLKDARIGQIFITEFRRSRQTAEPLAKLVAVEPTVIVSKDVKALADRLQSASVNVLVVGHSNTLPAIVRALGVEEQISVGEAEFDNLFVIFRSGTPSLLRLRYR